MSRLPKATYDSRFENCVFLKLHFERPQISGIDWLRLSGQDKIDVSMTIRFGQEQFMKIDGLLFGGEVYFGIRRGELELTLENCLMPVDKVILRQEFQMSFEVESFQEGGTEIQAGTASSVKSVIKISEKIKNSRSQIEQVGGEKSPKWIFKSKNEIEPLLGQLSKEKLGTIDVEAKPCKVTAIFQTSGKNVWINRGKVGLAEGKTLSANKWAAIERFVAINHIGTKLKEPISKVFWEYA